MEVALAQKAWRSAEQVRFHVPCQANNSPTRRFFLLQMFSTQYQTKRTTSSVGVIIFAVTQQRKKLVMRGTTSVLPPLIVLNLPMEVALAQKALRGVERVRFCFQLANKRTLVAYMFVPYYSSQLNQTWITTSLVGVI